MAAIPFDHRFTDPSCTLLPLPDLDPAPPGTKYVAVITPNGHLVRVAEDADYLQHLLRDGWRLAAGEGEARS